MLVKADKITGYKLNCRDGEIGSIDSFFFDDQHWTIRYLVANTGNWLTGKQVLISPYALMDVNIEEKYIIVDLSKQQIEDSPLLATNLPISQQFEIDYYNYYGWSDYWDGPYIWGNYPYIVRDALKTQEYKEIGKSWDHHLRDTNEVKGYYVHAIDGEIGHVEGFLIDDQTWAIRYLVLDTKNWWPGKKVLVSPEWVDSVSWGESKVFTNLTREMIQKSVEYTDELLLTREYETMLHRNYNRKGYWENEQLSSK